MTTTATESTDASRYTARQRLIGLLWAACDVYALGTLAFLAVRLVAGDGFWAVALFENVIQLALLASILPLALAAWRRRWRRAALYGSLMAIFLALYGELFLPSLGAGPACAAEQPGCLTHLRVMTFNLENDSIDTGKLIPLLRDSGAEVVALEEFSKGPAAVVKEQLSDAYPYQVQYEDAIPGVGLISKYPITSSEKFALRDQYFMFHIRATLDVNGAPLQVLLAHPVPPAMVFSVGGGFPVYTVFNSVEIRRLAQMAASGQPTLLLGDFNLTDQSTDYQVLRAAGLRDAFREAGWGLGQTWPLRGRFGIPLMRIDYIWLTPDFTATSAWVGGDAGSDHLPVIADLLWKH